MEFIVLNFTRHESVRGLWQELPDNEVMDSIASQLNWIINEDYNRDIIVCNGSIYKGFYFWNVMTSRDDHKLEEFQMFELEMDKNLPKWTNYSYIDRQIVE